MFIPPFFSNAFAWRRGLALGFGLTLAFSLAVCAEEPASEKDECRPPRTDLTESIDATVPAASDDDSDASQWYVFAGNVNNHPRLKSASKEIDRRINRSFRLLAPGFDDIESFNDQRKDMKVWTFFVGAGRVFSNRWDLFVQGGYAAGGVRTKATDPTVLFIPLHTDVTLERSSAFIGPGLAFYPCGTAERREYDSLRERLGKAKPFVAATLNFNYLTFDADVKAGLTPFKALLRKKDSRQWRVWSSGLVAGMDIPVSKRSVLSLNAQYNLFFDHGDDFSGPALSIYWKRFLGSPVRPALKSERFSRKEKQAAQSNEF